MSRPITYWDDDAPLFRVESSCDGKYHYTSRPCETYEQKLENVRAFLDVKIKGLEERIVENPECAEWYLQVIERTRLQRDTLIIRQVERK